MQVFQLGSIALVAILAVITNTAADAPDGVQVKIEKNFVYNDGDVEVLTDVEGNYEVREEDDVAVLTKHNFNYVVKNRDYVLVEFYAPWCGHCKALAPEYAKAAADLKKINVTVAKVDATIESALAKEWAIEAFPTIFLFHKGEKAEEYNGERSAEGIITYMAQRTDPLWKPPPSSVKDLTEENFRKVLDKTELALVMFYADYCKHCQKMKPDFMNAARKLKEYGIVLAQIEGTKAPKICDDFKVKGYPALFVFRFGRAFDYKGSREEKGIVEYMKAQLKPPSKKCDSSTEVHNRIERYNPTILGFFTSDKSKFYEEFKAVANFLRNEPIKFLHSFDLDTAKSFNVKIDVPEKREAIVVVKPPVFASEYEDSHIILTDTKFTGDEIAEFIRANYRPLVGQRTKENSLYFYSSRPLVVVYYDANFDHQYQKDSELIRSKVVEVAKEFPNIAFAVANEEEYAAELEAVKLDDSGADVNVVWYDNNRLKYRMDPVDDDFDGSDLRKFVHQAVEGLLKPVWKSQPIPKQAEGSNVTVVVADNFDEVVLKPKEERDTLFYVYAPWCGHCKEFEKTYKKIGKHMSGPRLLLTKMDGTQNDLPPGFEVRGYPTIFFIPAKKKHEPLLYEGDRSYKDFKKFINQHSTIFLTEEEREGRNKVEL